MLKSRRVRVAIILAGMLLAPVNGQTESPNARSTQTSAADTVAIEAVIRGIFKDFARGNPAGIEAAESADVTVWDVFTPQLIQGQKALKDFHAADKSQMQSRGALHLDVEDGMVLDVWGDTAIARYYISFTYDPPNATSGRIRITDVLRRIEGRWLVAHHHEGMVPEGVPPIAKP
jgi:ketosteroid isomerase-like protein